MSLRLCAMSLSALLSLCSCRGEAEPQSVSGANSCADLTMGTWAPTTETLEPRHLAGAVVLPDGRVLVSGGETTGLSARGDPSNSAEVYEPDRDRWVRVAPMRHARAGHRLVLLGDGTVLCVGGGTSAGEIYDPSANAWTALTGRSPGRVGATVVSLPGNRLAIVGGDFVLPGPSMGGEHYESTPSTEIFDVATRRWKGGPRLNRLRASGVGAAAGDGTIVMVGGNHYQRPLIKWELFGDRPGPVSRQTRGIDVLQPNATGWRTLRFPRAYGGTGAAAIGISSHEVLILGGAGEGHGSAAAFVFDTSNQHLAATSPMLVERYAAMPVVLRPGCVMVIGGAGPSDPSEVYSSEERRWRAFPRPPGYDGTLALRLADGSVMVLGDYHRPKDAYRYRPTSGARQRPKAR